LAGENAGAGAAALDTSASTCGSIAATEPVAASAIWSGESWETGAAGAWAGEGARSSAPRQLHAFACSQQHDEACEPAQRASVAQGAIARSQPAAVSAINFRTGAS
jgi:hypothetical protein